MLSAGDRRWCLGGAGRWQKGAWHAVLLRLDDARAEEPLGIGCRNRLRVEWCPRRRVGAGLYYDVVVAGGVLGDDEEGGWGYGVDFVGFGYF